LERKSLIIKSKRSEIKRVEEILESLNSRLKMKKEKFINFQIAASEALINAIVHGNKENEEKYVSVVFEFDEKQICLTIKDEGKGFDIDSLPDPTKEENLLKECGRGIFIMRSLVDDLDCKSCENGATLKLVMKK
jgi:serine/threonine-protein kinase RsbW